MLKGEAGMEWETSECSSGCDSGWTMYLGAGLQSCEEAATPRDEGHEAREDEEDNDDSLSMASDASSGPPHAHEDSFDHYCNDNGLSCAPSSPPSTPSAAPRSEAGKRRRVEKKQLRQQGEASAYDYLDDAASSFFFGFSEKSFDLPNSDICSRSSSKRASMEEALEFSCGFSETHLEDQAQGGKKMRITSSILF